MKSRSFAAFIAISALVVLTTPASAAQDASTQADGTATTTPANPVPLINQPLVPDTKIPGAAAFTLTLNGTGFVSGALVKWNGKARTTTFVSSSQLKASILASDIAKAGTASVRVVNPSPGGGTSNVAFFTITSNTGSSVGFYVASSLAAGTGPVSVAVGDFNGDRKLDLAVTSQASDTVSILLGDGTGKFTLASSAANTHPDTGRHYHYQPKNKDSGQPLELDLTTVHKHLAGWITIGLYAINPQSQRCKWIAICADYDDAFFDLGKLKGELELDGVSPAGDVPPWRTPLDLCEQPLLAEQCRVYVYNVALRLGVPIKGAAGLREGIEILI